MDLAAAVFDFDEASESECLVRKTKVSPCTACRTDAGSKRRKSSSTPDACAESAVESVINHLCGAMPNLRFVSMADIKPQCRTVCMQTRLGLRQLVLCCSTPKP